MKTLIAQLIKNVIADLQENAELPKISAPDWQVEHTRLASHGDFACNVAMIWGKAAKIAPRKLAEKLVSLLPPHPAIQKIEIAGPGFLNFFLDSSAHLQVIPDILSKEKMYGHSDFGQAKKVLVEFVSTNPTGPLHVGHGRAAVFGSALIKILKAVGFAVHGEYYVNDAGRQMDILTTTVWLRYLEICGEWVALPSNAYQGEYIRKIAQDFFNLHQQALQIDSEEIFENLNLQSDTLSDDEKEKQMDILIARTKAALEEDYEDLAQFTLQQILQGIQQDLTDFNVHFDEWFSEKTMLAQGEGLTKVLENLRKNNYLYEKDGATWFRSTDFGDDKDRVVIRENGQSTYFASDIAYHANKFARGYDIVLDILGSDHHGYVTRVRAAMAALGYQAENLEIILIQFALLWRGSERLSMSTRSGSFVTLRELYQETGIDAARYFYLMRKNDQHLDFDLELAKQQNNDNPVYYIQYAHARICSVLRQCVEKNYEIPSSCHLETLKLLTQPQERELITILSRYAETIESAAKFYEPHVLTTYLKELAQAFHTYYNSEVFLVEEKSLRDARLTLLKATRQILQNGLDLLGISAPEKM